MARKQNLKYLLTKELSEMYAQGKGKSKKEYIEQTNRVREQMKREGAPYKESLRYNASENLIFSESTFQNYKKHIGYFCDYLAEQTGNKKMDVESTVEETYHVSWYWWMVVGALLMLVVIVVLRKLPQTSWLLFWI